MSLTSANTDAQLGVNLDLLSAGSTFRRDATYEGGRLLTASFIETEYLDVESFLRSVDVEAWAQARVDAPNKERDMDTERSVVTAFIGQLRQQATATQSYTARHSLKPEAVATINAYRSVAMLAEREGGGQEGGPSMEDRAVIDAMNNAVEAVWSNPDSVYPYSLRAYERSSKESGLGMNLVVQLAALHGAEATHINNRLDVA